MRQTGRRWRTEHLDVRASASPLSFARSGLVVPKHGKTAVERNKLKRRLRELVRTMILASSEILRADVFSEESPQGIKFNQTLQVGSVIQLGLAQWEIHAAGGHDPHAVIFFEPESRVLISADALWQSGFGVIFPELEGIDAFNEVATTLDVIERLNPHTVIPGHGAVFKYTPEILSIARRKLDDFVKDPVKLARHGAKVLLKFKLLEKQKPRDKNHHAAFTSDYLV